MIPCSIGLIHYKRGQKEQAFAAFREYLFRAVNEPSLNEPNIYAYIPVTRIALESIGTAKEVIATYRHAIQAIQTRPRDEVVLALGEFLLQEGMVDEALELYREELAARREHSALASRLAKQFSQSGHGDEALAVCREGIKALPDSLDLHLATRRPPQETGDGGRVDTRKSTRSFLSITQDSRRNSTIGVKLTSRHFTWNEADATRPGSNSGS